MNSTLRAMGFYILLNFPSELVAQGDFGITILRLKARGFNHPRRGTLN
jgi:hypothetical protein